MMSDHFMQDFYTRELSSGRVSIKLLLYDTFLENLPVEDKARNKGHPVNEGKSRYIK